jgi:hypothetical protein
LDRYFFFFFFFFKKYIQKSNRCVFTLNGVGYAARTKSERNHKQTSRSIDRVVALVSDIVS